MKMSLPVLVIVLGLIAIGATSYLSNGILELRKSNVALSKALSEKQAVNCPKPIATHAIDDYVQIHRNVTM